MGADDLTGQGDIGQILEPCMGARIGRVAGIGQRKLEMGGRRLIR